MDFKAGNVVVCINNKDHETNLTEGMTYMVDRECADLLFVVDNRNYVGGYFTNRFQHTQQILCGV